MVRKPQTRDEPIAFCDDGKGQGGGRLFTGLSGILTISESKGVDETLSSIQAAGARGLWTVLLAEYELGYLLEPRVLDRPYSPEAPLLTALLFERMTPLSREGVDAWLSGELAVMTREDRECVIADCRPGLDETAFIERVERIRRYIADGDCYQVNFTFPVRLRLHGDPLALYGRLRPRQPTRYGAFVRMRDRTILSLSPELFLLSQGDRLISKPMKGTAARGATSEEDAGNRDRLAASEKDRAENVMIVDLIRSDLGRIAEWGGVRVDRLFEIEAYPTVWQMTSTVSARAPGVSLREVLRGAFPCGSVTGAPKIRAMQIIEELEEEARGLYTGAVGTIAPDGEMQLNVAIRTLVLDRDGTGRLGIGSGIVYDSDPAGEYAECEWKGRFLTMLDPGFELIETLLCTPSEADPYPHLALHLKRLEASARHFGFRFDALDVETRLLQESRSVPPAGRFRVRLLLAKSGGVRVESAPIDPPDPVGPLRVMLSSSRVDSRDPFLYHKTTRRWLYEAELGRLGEEDPAVFDLLFRNERGELTEGARSNLFLAFGPVLHTPPVSAGLLNGVMRRHLITTGRPAIVERTLYPADLERADRVYVANAVRGLKEAEVARACLPRENGIRRND